MQDLVLITGPIASGKSTLARALARHGASQGRSTATVDLDEVAFTQDGCEDLDELWRRAGIAHAALVGGWLGAGTDVVIAHGPFAEAGSYDAFEAMASAEVRLLHVVLTVRLDVAQQRVEADPDRPASTISRDPTFLRSAHAAFASLELPPADATFDTSDTPASSIAAQLAERLTSRSR